MLSLSYPGDIGVTMPYDDVEVTMSIQRFVAQRIDAVKNDHIDAVYRDNDYRRTIAIAKFTELREMALYLKMPVCTVREFIHAR